MSAALQILQVGVDADMGNASCMEDEHCISCGSSFALFGVYDGHSGTMAAQFCREQLHLLVTGSPHFGRKGDTGARRALLEGFMLTEQVWPQLLAQMR